MTPAALPFFALLIAESPVKHQHVPPRLVPTERRHAEMGIHDLEAFERREVMKNRDTHFVHADGDMTPELLMQKYPLLEEIIQHTGDPVIPVDLIIAKYPALWQQFKEDPPVWRWFQTHLPQYTIDRVEGGKAASSISPPFPAPDPVLQFLLECEHHLNKAKGAANAPLTEANAGQWYSRYQVLKWQWKNYQRATGRAAAPARAWESHTLDRDYPGWFTKYHVPANARVLDIGTEFGLQAVALAKAYPHLSVTGTDVGEAELKIAAEYAKRESGLGLEARVRFVVDNILDGSSSKLSNSSFDVVIDRAVYHSIMPYLAAEPRLRRVVDARFAERIRALLKPGGLFIFKGMSLDEEGFRPAEDAPERQRLGELNTWVAYELAQAVVRRFGSLRAALAKMPHGTQPDEALFELGKLVDKADKAAGKKVPKGGRFVPATLQFDLNKYPMPWHFSPSEIHEIFVERMGFVLHEAGQSHFFNDKADTSLMPKVEYAILGLSQADMRRKNTEL